MKAMYDREMKHVRDLDKKLRGKVDAVINMDLHGNMQIQYTDKDGAQTNEEDEKPIESYQAQATAPRDGMTEPGTYVLRNGKLVPGKGETRE
jgi:hypothetical protein